MLGKGEGKTKKQSEQEAAKLALHELQQADLPDAKQLSGSPFTNPSAGED